MQGDNGLPRQTVPIRCGRADWSARVQPTSISVELKNKNGRLTPNNPTSQWYPYVRRGTPLRHEVKAGPPHLTLTGAAGSKASTPDDASLDITADWFLAVEVEPPVPSGISVLTGKYSTVGDQRSVLLSIENTSVPSVTITWSTDGTLANEHSLFLFPDPTWLPLPLWGPMAYGVWLDVDNGASGHTATLYVANSIDAIEADPTGTAVATAIGSGTTSVHSGSAPLEIGALANGPGTAAYIGKIRRARVRAGSSAGALRADPDFGIQASGTTSFTDSAGRPWTVSAPAMVENWQTRFVGQIDEIAPHWVDGDPDGAQRVSVTASGMLRRLTQGAKAFGSSLYRSITSAEFASSVKAYWPFEDESGATVAASPMSGVEPASVTGVSFAGDNTLDASRALANIAGGTGAAWVATSPAFTASDWMVELPLRVPTVATSPSWTLLWSPKSTGTVKQWFYEVNSTTMRIRGIDAGGTEIVNSSVAGTPAGAWHNLAIKATQDGANVDWEGWFTQLDGSGTGVTGTVAGTVGRPTDIGYFATAPADGISFGHVIVTTGRPVGWLGGQPGANNGWVGETAANRFIRLCQEEGVPFLVFGDPDASAPMGPQRPGTLVDLLQECADAELGILCEQRHSIGLAFRTRGSLYNQDPLFDVDALSKGLVNPFDPVLDDQRLRNDITVTRVNGSSTTVTDDTSVGAEGRYQESVPALNVWTDGQLPDIAGWELHRGTQPDLRYESLSFKLGAPALTAAWLTAGLGDIGRVSELPSHHPVGPVDQFIEEFTEKIGSFRWDVEITGTPAGIWTVGVVEDEVLGRADTDGSELHALVDADDTSFDVAVTDGPMWTVDNAEFPFEAKLAGEVVNVTDIAASLVTFGATGTAAHAVNASVTPGLPASIAQYNLLLCLAGIRNSGTGVPNTPAGYVRLPVFYSADNVQLFAKVAGSSESAPTVTFTGGVANADTSAQMIRLAGNWHDAANVLATARSCLNASAQDIAYPRLEVPEDNCIILYLGWKQDDWTSVATIGGATEIGEPFTTTGDDQGLVWDYLIQTTRATVAAGSFVVTGGAAAISRGAVVVLRCDRQTWTVTRSVNGIVKSHAAGTPISLATPMVAAL